MPNPTERSSPMVLGFHHIAIVVKDAAAAANFYRSVFEFSDRDRLTASTSAHGGAWFQVGALELHLQERKNEVPKSDQHLALLTDRLDEICVRAANLGGRIGESRPMKGMSKRCFVYDPDGNRIELLQR